MDQKRNRDLHNIGFFRRDKFPLLLEIYWPQRPKTPAGHQQTTSDGWREVWWCQDSNLKSKS